VNHVLEAASSAAFFSSLVKLKLPLPDGHENLILARQENLKTSRRENLILARQAPDHRDHRRYAGIASGKTYKPAMMAWIADASLTAA
jgi:hypothetical protein